jgi:hypothetical protein
MPVAYYHRSPLRPAAGLVAGVLLLSGVFPLLAQSDDKQSAAAADLVDDDLFEGLPPAPATSAPEAASPEAPTPETGRPEAPTLSGGEDLDFGGQADPFGRLAAKMQRSREALAMGNSAAPTQDLQQEILSDLDALLKKMQKQCAGGQCNTPGSSAGNSPGTGQKPSSRPPNDSTARVGKPGDTEVQPGEEADTMREVWGHLPPKVREAMQNATLEEFLPKYDKLIEDFYRRLAEQPTRGS